MSKSILITSGKGGVGKSTVCTMLGTALAEQGSSVLLLETDCGLRNLDIMNGLENEMVYDLGDVLLGRCEPARAIVKSPYSENLDLLPATVSPHLQFSETTLSCLILGLKNFYDYILVDCPAGFDSIFNAVLHSVDMGIVVAVPNAISVKDAAKAADLFYQAGLAEGRLIINILQKNWKSGEFPADFDEIIDTVGLQLLGVVPHNAKMSQALNTGKKIALNGKSSVFSNIARRIKGEYVPLKIK